MSRADLGYLRLGIGTSGHHERRRGCRGRKQCILDDDSCVGIGVMGELQAGADIACRIDFRIGGSQLFVHGNQPVTNFHTRLVELHPFHIRAAPRGDQYLPGGDADPVGVQDWPVLTHGDVGDEGTQVKRYAVGLKRLPKHGSGARRLAGQDPVSQFEQVNVDTETSHGLRHLATDGSGAEYRQPAWQFHQVEERFVGKGIARRQARDRRHGGPRSRGDDKASCAEPMLSNRDAFAVEKFRRAEENIHAVPAITFHRVVMGDLRPDLPQPGKGFVGFAAGIPPREFQQRL